MINEIEILKQVENCDFQCLSDLIADIKREYKALDEKLNKVKKRIDAIVTEIKKTMPDRETTIKLKYSGKEYYCYINSNGELIIEELPYWDWATIKEKILYIKIFKAYIYALWRLIDNFEEELKKIELE